VVIAEIELGRERRCLVRQLRRVDKRLALDLRSRLRRPVVRIDEPVDVPPEPQAEQQVTVDGVQRLRELAAAAVFRERAGFFSGAGFFDA
jgi:hypothetical protein